MFCSKCGTQNEDSAKFCIKCGTQLIRLGLSPESPLPSHPPSTGKESEAQIKPGGPVVQTGKPTTGSWVSVGGAILILLLFFAPWASCSGTTFTGLDIVTESEGEYAWVAAVPFCALVVTGILYAFRRQIKLSAWLRIVSGIGGLIPMIKLYSDMREVAQLEWGSIGTVFGLGAVILGGVQDLVAKGNELIQSRQRTNSETEL